MAEPQIDPSLLDEGVGTSSAGRGVKRKTRNSGDNAAAPAARVSTRFAGKASDNMGVGVGIGVGRGGRGKGKGKDMAEASESVDVEPSRGEEENLIGSEYKLRGKRGRGGRGRTQSQSPVKKRANTAASTDKGKQSTARMDGLAAAAAASPSQPAPNVPPRPPYPIGRRPFLFPCIRPDLPPRPPGDPARIFKRFDPHEFDDPKALEAADDSLSSEDEDYTVPPVLSTSAQEATNQDGNGVAQGYGNLADMGLGDVTAEGLDYDTQAYQSLAALLEASNDTGLFDSVADGGIQVEST